MAWRVIVLAAGRGRRMGGPKALMLVGGRPWWQVQEQRLRRLGLESTWVVSAEVGRAVEGVQKIAGDPDAPMFSSVRAGLAAADVDDGVLVLPVDVPAPSPAVAAALTNATGEGVAIPTFESKRGHPVALSGLWIARVFNSGRGVDERLDRLIAPDAVEVPVDDPSVVVNLNTPEDVARWSDGSGRR